LPRPPAVSSASPQRAAAVDHLPPPPPAHAPPLRPPRDRRRTQKPPPARPPPRPWRPSMTMLPPAWSSPSPAWGPLHRLGRHAPPSKLWGHPRPPTAATHARSPGARYAPHACTGGGGLGKECYPPRGLPSLLAVVMDAKKAAAPLEGCGRRLATTPGVWGRRCVAAPPWEISATTATASAPPRPPLSLPLPPATDQVAVGVVARPRHVPPPPAPPSTVSVSTTNRNAPAVIGRGGRRLRLPTPPAWW